MKPRVLEKDIQRAICEWLAKGDFFFWRSNNIPVFGASNDGVKRFRALPKFTPRGIPDIMVIKNGDFYALEVKRPGAVLRPEQMEFRDKVTQHGAFYYMVTSVSDVEEIFSGSNL